MLFIDCGNTALKCLYLSEYKTFYYADSNFNNDVKTYVESLTQDTKVVLSSVATLDIEQLVLGLLRDHFAAPVQIAKTEEKFLTLQNGYEQFQQLGVDRWLSMLAVAEQSGTKLLIDAGSWIKVDVISNQGEHQGGAIISKQKKDEVELFKRFDLQATQCESLTRVLGVNTFQCLCASLHQYGVEALLNLVQKYLQNNKQKVHIIVTGGDAKKISEHLAYLKDPNIEDIQCRYNLVLSGLLIRYGTE